MDGQLIDARVFHDGVLVAITNSFFIMMFLTAIFTSLVVSTLMYYGLFKKVGIDTGYAFIPIYREVLLFKIAYGSRWYFLTLFIPFVNIWFAFGVNNRIGKLFGKSLTWRIVFMHIFGPLGLYIVGYGKGEEPIQQEQ